MSQIEILNKLGMVSKDDESYIKPNQDWDGLLKTLADYKSPQAVRLYKKISSKYNLSTINQRKETNMADENTTAPVETPSEQPVGDGAEAEQTN